MQAFSYYSLYRPEFRLELTPQLTVSVSETIIMIISRRKFLQP